MKSINALIIICGLLLMSACGAPRNLFVLMPDADGTVGKIFVKNDAGEQIITTAGTGVKIMDAKTAPTPPESIPEQEIKEIFQSAMNATPQPPARFILQFKSGTTTLTDKSQALLPQILATVKARQPCDIYIAGHTDTAGPAQKNWELGLQRAKSVKQILIDQGLAADQIEAVSHGENDLLIPTPDNTEEPKNRRVEVLIR